MSSHALAGVLSTTASNNSSATAGQNNNSLSSPTTASSRGGGGYHQQQQQHYSSGTRKMDRVFTQTMGAQTAPPPRYMRNSRRPMGSGGNTNMDYMMGPAGGGMGPIGSSASAMYQQMPTHYRTISGSGGVDEYDYAPPQQSMNYYDRAPPVRRRMRGGGQMQGTYMMRQQGDMNRRFNNGPRRMGMRNHQPQQQRYVYEEEAMPPMRNTRYRKDSMRTSFRNGERYFVNDDRNPARTAKPRIRRRSTRTRYSQGGDQSDHQNQQPEANRNENQASKDDTGRRRGSSRRRRRRTNSSIAAASGQPGTANKPAIRSASVNGGAGNPAANRNRKFVCNVCKQSFRTDSLRLRHLRLFHPRRRDFVCKECRGVFPTAKSITTHLSTPHQEERLPIAEVRRRAKPGIPIRYVSDGLPIFSCKYCPFGFLTANDAESHQTRCRASQRLSINMDLEYPGNDQYVIYCFCCPELLSVHQNMKEHFKCLHNFVDLSISYHCSICKSGRFDSEAEAADHFKQAHTDKHLEEFRNKRKDEYIEESLKSYQMQRPVSMLRVKAEVRQVMNKLLRQVSATLKASPPS